MSTSKLIQLAIALAIIFVGLVLAMFPQISELFGEEFAIVEIILPLASIICTFWLFSIVIRPANWRMNRGEAIGWEERRRIGRARYITRFLLISTIPILFFMTFAGISHFSATGIYVGSVVAIVFFVFLIFFAAGLVADALWKKNERDFAEIVKSEASEQYNQDE